MLTHPTLEKLRTLQLRGMAAALEDQARTPDIDSLSFEERLGLLLDREETSRADRRLKTRLTQARLRVQASLEDIDHRARRGLDKAVLLDLAKGDGRYRTLLASLQRIDLLILDDWGVTPMGDANRRDQLELLDDRYASKSTLITSQLPVDAWHEYLADPTLADAILDRFIHNAHRLDMRDDSMRKTRSTLTGDDPTSEG